MKINNLSYKKLHFLINRISIFKKGYAPWFNWESENASLGKCIRYYSFYPKFLPLIVNSDHGVHSESKLWKNELLTKKTVPYLTWNYRKYLKFKKLKRNVYYINNPFSFYFKNKIGNNNKINKINEINGTLIVYPHSNLKNTPIINNDNYFRSLKKLPKSFHPLNILVSFHDIKNNNYLKLFKYKLPIYTAGNTISSDFIDNLREIMIRYKYITSPISEHSIGSTFFYSVDLGIKNFFFHKVKFKIYKSHDDLKKGIIKKNIFLDRVDRINLKKLQNIFSLKNFHKVKNPKKKIIRYMGYDSKINRLNLFTILFKSFLINLDLVVILYLKYFFNYSKKFFHNFITLRNTLKKYIL